MSDVRKAIDFVMKQEDAKLSGTVTNNVSDRGGATRFGLCARFHPDLVKADFYNEVATSAVDALEIAAPTFEREYTTPMHLDEIEDQSIANALLSFAVNEGIPEAVSMLQKSANTLGAKIPVDGNLGPVTIKAVNAIEGRKLIPTLGEFQKTYYRHIAAVNPSQAVFLNGWLNRANATELTAA